MGFMFPTVEDMGGRIATWTARGGAVSDDSEDEHLPQHPFGDDIHPIDRYFVFFLWEGFANAVILWARDCTRAVLSLACSETSMPRLESKFRLLSSCL